VLAAQTPSTHAPPGVRDTLGSGSRRRLSLSLPCCYQFPYRIKAGPAGGRLRRPSSRRQRHDGYREAGLAERCRLEVRSRFSVFQAGIRREAVDSRSLGLGTGREALSQSSGSIDASVAVSSGMVSKSASSCPVTVLPVS
jgi:hypothetical protein